MENTVRKTGTANSEKIGRILDGYRKDFYRQLATDPEFRRMMEEPGKNGCCRPLNPLHEVFSREYLDRIAGNPEKIEIGTIYYKGTAYPVREIRAGYDVYTVFVKRLEELLVYDTRNMQQEAMETDGRCHCYCSDEEMCTMTDAELHEMIYG